MQIAPEIFKSYDIRGIYPTEINEENLPQILKAIYLFFTRKVQKQMFTVVLGADMRISSPSLLSVAKETLISLGANVIDVEILSTPTFYFAVSHYGYDTGIQITASHNPKEYTGLKFVINTPDGLIKIGKSTGMEEIKAMSLKGEGAQETNTKGTITTKTGILADEVTNALSLFDNPQLGTYKIVADPANAMGGTYIQALFEKVPAELVKMNFELDGNFPVHQPDPLQKETLVELQKRVVAEKADFGLAPDGDGDRLFFIDEKGAIVPPTIITSLIAREMLKKQKGSKILFDIRYILTPQKIVAENGGESVITKVGHAFITEEMHASGGIFAGESSGHYFFKATGNAESQIPVIVAVLKVLTQEQKTLSEVAKEIQRSFESGEINFTVNNASSIMEKLREQYKDGSLSELDGIAISYDTWRFSVRTSNTEPLLRLNVESYDEKTMEEKRDAIVATITQLKT